MEAKDVALLGFVSAASKYVEKHMGEDLEISELKDIDIKLLKDKLSEELKSLAMSNENKTKLLKAGESAFKEYEKDNLKHKKSVIDQLGEIFDVNFDDEEQQDENIDDLDEEEVEESFAVTEKDDDVLDEFGLSANDDILLQITNAAAKSDEELAKEFEQKIVKPENLDSAFAEVIDAENINSKFNQAAIDELSKAIAKTTLKTDTVNEETVKEISKVLTDNLFNSKEVVKEETKEEIKQDIKEEVEEKVIYETPRVPLSSILKGIGEQEAFDTGYFKEETKPEIKEDDIFKIIVDPDPTFKPQFAYDYDAKPTDSLDILTNPGLDIILEREEEDAKTYYNLVQEEEKVISTKEDEPQDQTLSQALSALSNLQKKQEEHKIVTPPSTNENVYQKIMEAYPYLSKGFIKSAYAQKEEIKDDYINGEPYIILHRLMFNDIDELHEFVEIMMSHDYSVNVDEKQMIVDTFKEFINDEGVVLSNILSIANQAKILNGSYEGYRVINKEGR